MKRHYTLGAVLTALSVLSFFAGGPAATRIEAQSSGATRPITRADIKAWKNIGSPTASRDGQWFAYILTPNEGDSRTVFRRLGDGRELGFDSGDTPPSGIQFADNSRWAVFNTAAPFVPDRSQQSTATGTALLNLESGDVRRFDRVRRSAFNGKKSTVVALHLNAAPGTSGSTGDLVLVDLVSGALRNIGNVGEFAFDSTGERLVYTVASRDQTGNAVVLRDVATGVERVLESERASYRNLVLSDADAGVAAVTRLARLTSGDTAISFVLFSSLLRGTVRKQVVDLRAERGMPPGFVVDGSRPVRFTENHQGLYFHLRKATAPDSAASTGTALTANRPALVLWHYLDEKLQRRQELDQGSSSGPGFFMLYWLNDRRLITVADTSYTNVTVAPRDRWAFAVDDRDYRLQAALDGQELYDLHVVDLRTGQRRTALQRSSGTILPSPDGELFSFYSDGNYFTYEVTTGRTRNITERVPTSFVDDETDVNATKPPRPVVDWAADSRSLLISDGWDIWSVPTSGTGAVNVTGNGKQDSIRYRARLFRKAGERGIDLTQPFHVSAYGEWTKREGVARIEPSRQRGARAASFTTAMFLWEDADLAIFKARDSERYFYTQQTSRRFPDYYATDATLATGARITAANPQQNDLNWTAGSRLVEFRSAKGKRLQATLHLPAQFEEGRAYPTIVLVYERQTQWMHAFSVPRLDRDFSRALYTSRGYAVLEPDISYELNDPGMSAVWCVIPAVEAAIATGVVDRDRVGLYGHSWGGYETAFLITQSTLFKAAVAGAPISNLVSMYSSVYWNEGQMNSRIFESSQGRFTSGFWENHEAFVRNSPIFHAAKVETPLLIMHNDADGAVDFNQGLELYSALRRMGKPVVLLQYEGENHSLSNPANQQDYAIRMAEYFEHHLRGAPAPDWWLRGVPRSGMDAHLRARAGLVIPP